MELVESWIQDHRPNGTSSLSSEYTSPSIRGNLWEEVIHRGGRQAAIARQAPPEIEAKTADRGVKVEASVGRWDPGVTLKAQWLINGKPALADFEVKQWVKVSFTPTKKGRLQLEVTGKKRNYANETRCSNVVIVGK